MFAASIHFSWAALPAVLFLSSVFEALVLKVSCLTDGRRNETGKTGQDSQCQESCHRFASADSSLLNKTD